MITSTLNSVSRIYLRLTSFSYLQTKNMSLEFKENPFIPVNNRGKAVDLEQELTAPGVDAAINIYQKAARLLLTPAQWHAISGIASATFTVLSEDAVTSNMLLKAGDFIRVDIPGPGNLAGKGYDWVRVRDVKENIENGADESLGLSIYSSPPPGSLNREAAHFFKDGASSTFIITRIRATVRITYHGRNEIPNTDTGHTLNDLRNRLVAAGAAAGFSELQWGALIKGILINQQ